MAIIIMELIVPIPVNTLNQTFPNHRVHGSIDIFTVAGVLNSNTYVLAINVNRGPGRHNV